MSIALHNDQESFTDGRQRRSSSSLSMAPFEVESYKPQTSTMLIDFSNRVQIKQVTWRIMVAMSVLAVFILLALVATILYYELRPSSSSDSSASVASNTQTNQAACTDFYQYTCGSWLAANSLPPYAYEIQMLLTPISTQDNAVIEQILNGSLPSSPVLRTFYESCMDTDSVAALSWLPLIPYFEAIDNITDVTSYMAFAGSLLAATGQSVLLGAIVQPDPANPSINALFLGAAGLSLPNPRYYDLADMIVQLQILISHFFSDIVGVPAEQAQEVGLMVAIVEYGIAQMIEWPITLPSAIHFTDINQLSAYNASLDVFLSNANVTFENNPFNVYMFSPSFFGNISDLFSTFDIEILQAHAMWILFIQIAHLLDAVSSEISFQLQYNVLLGQQEPQPRDQYCLAQVNEQLGGQIDAAFINVTWSADTLQQVDDMIAQLRSAFSQSISGFYWMDETTKMATAMKLEDITAFVGGRPIVPGSESLILSSTAFLDNYLQLAALTQRVAIASLSSPVPIPKHIVGSGTDVNAAYYPPYNSINVYAGLVQPSIFNISASPLVNLARLGVIIGHELTHGFDNTGRLFDGQGQLRQWWTNASIQNFNNQTQCIVDHYSSMFVRQGNSGGFIDGELTLGENIADFGGVHFAYQAYRNWLSASQPLTTAAQQQALDQQFFTAYGQLWCTQSSPQSLLRNLMDVHSPYPARINGPLQMLPPFAAAYGCPIGSPMNPTTQCFVY